MRSPAGTLDIHPARDRAGVHQPTILKKWERELGSGMDEIILSLYAQSQSVEDVRFELRQLYGVEMSAGTIMHRNGPRPTPDPSMAEQALISLLFHH